MVVPDVEFEARLGGFQCLRILGYEEADSTSGIAKSSIARARRGYLQRSNDFEMAIS